MAFLAPQLGDGTTIGFGTRTTLDALQWTSIAQDGSSVEDIETSYLATTGGKTYIAADLTEGGTFTARCNADTDVIPTAGGAVEAITVTPPITDSANSTAPTVVFNGYINNYATVYENGVLVAYDVTIKVAGTIVHTASST